MFTSAMKYYFLSVLLLGVTVQLSYQVPPKVVNNQTEEVNDTKIVINFEVTNTQKRIHTITNEVNGQKEVIQQDEVILTESFVVTESPSEELVTEPPVDVIVEEARNNVIPVGSEAEDEVIEPVASLKQIPQVDSDPEENSTEAFVKTCGDHETYQECGPRCYQTCTFAPSTLRKPKAVCETGCNPGCYCNSGYVRFNDRCVLPETCPARPCRLNEEWTECGTACSLSCDSHSFKDQIKAECLQLCIPGCFCKDGFVRNNLGMCILPTRCPRPSSS